MEYITLKHSDITVSRLCMGGCPMGGYGWGETNEKEFIDSIHAALDSGVNYFDTSDTYGLGQSEETLAKGLAGRRQEAVVQTKFGVHVHSGKTEYDNSPRYIRQALENSLRRLKTDYVDIYVIHNRDTQTSMAEVVGTLDDLKTEGKIRTFGLSNIHMENMEEIKPYREKFVNFQDEFSLVCQKNADDIQAISKVLGLTPMTWGSLGQGILTGKYGLTSSFGADDRRSRDIYVNFHGEKLERNLRIVEGLREIAESYGKSLAACAIRYILDEFPESVALVGVKRPAQLYSNIEALDWHFSEQDMEDLHRLVEEYVVVSRETA